MRLPLPLDDSRQTAFCQILAPMAAIRTAAMSVQLMPLFTRCAHAAMFATFIARSPADAICLRYGFAVMLHARR